MKSELAIIGMVLIVALVGIFMVVGQQPAVKDSNLAGSAINTGSGMKSKTINTIVSQPKCICSRGGDSWPADPGCIAGGNNCMQCCIMEDAEDGSWVD